MLYTGPHNQFKLLQERAVSGESLNMDLQVGPGYQAPYAEWMEENKAVLPILSAEDRTLSLTDAMEEKVVERQVKIIDEKEPNPTKRKELVSQAVRGDLLLVSTDEGAHFDQVLTLEEAKKKSPLALRILSATLRSSTLDLTELKEEQNLLHATKKLRQQHFLVGAAYVENHVIHISATHPKQGAYDVEVPLNQAPQLPLEYTFTNKEGKKRVAETQLPEAFGEAKPESRFANFSHETRHDNSFNKENLARAAIAGGLGLLGAKTLGNQRDAAARALLAAQDTRNRMKSPAVHDNMSARNAMKARKARQDKEAQVSNELDKKREDSYPKEAKEAYEKKEAKEQENTKNQNAALAQFTKNLKIGTAAAGGLFGSASSVMFYIAHSSNS